MPTVNVLFSRAFAQVIAPFCVCVCVSITSCSVQPTTYTHELERESIEQPCFPNCVSSLLCCYSRWRCCRARRSRRTTTSPTASRSCSGSRLVAARARRRISCPARSTGASAASGTAAGIATRAWRSTASAASRACAPRCRCATSLVVRRPMARCQARQTRSSRAMASSLSSATASCRRLNARPTPVRRTPTALRWSQTASARRTRSMATSRESVWIRRRAARCARWR